MGADIAITPQMVRRAAWNSTVRYGAWAGVSAMTAWLLAPIEPAGTLDYLAAQLGTVLGGFFFFGMLICIAEVWSDRRHLLRYIARAPDVTLARAKIMHPTLFGRIRVLGWRPW